MQVKEYLPAERLSFLGDFDQVVAESMLNEVITKLETCAAKFNEWASQ
jgi:hypothetical protein